jgi:L-malate glycosyltransferase
MNILHITSYLQGGAGRIIVDLASSQAAAGHKVTVVTTGTPVDDYGNYPQWVERLEAECVSLRFVDSTFTRSIPLNISAFRQIYESIDCRSISFIHAHAAIPSLIALLIRARERRPLPIIQTMHGWGISKNAEQTVTDITLMNQLDRVVTPSMTSKCLLSDLGVSSNLIECIPYGIAQYTSPEGEYDVQVLHQWKSQGYMVLVCMGTVGIRKNQRLLLKALSRTDSPQNLACAIIGEGQDIPELKAFVHANGMAERVHFFGYQPAGECYLNYADWLVLPSSNEGLPISILEAFRAGVPVLGSDIPEIVEIIQPLKTGILFRAGDLDSLVQALARVAMMPSDIYVKMSAVSKMLWEKQYSSKIMMENYAQLYLKLSSKELPTPWP